MNRPFHTVQSVRFIGEIMELTVDGRTCTFDVAAISDRLAKATPKQRLTWQVSPSGYGIHWSLIDEDLSIDGLLRATGVAPAHAFVHEPPARYGGKRGPQA
jgi:hypothetical protein